MISRICISFHYRRTNWSSISQFIYRYCTTRHLLRSSTFPLRIINRGSFCHYSRFHSMISLIYKINTKSQMIKNSIHHYIFRGKFNILPPTLSWISRDTSTIFRLPRFLHCLKCFIINWLNNFIRKNPHIHFHHMRKNNN